MHVGPMLPVYSRLFAHLDQDKDGILSHEEMQMAKTLLRAHGGLGNVLISVLEVADVDKDGVVSLQDWQTYTSKCDLGEAVVAGLGEVLQELDRVPAGWARLPMPGRGQLGFYCRDLDIWTSDAHLIETFPSKCRVFDSLLTKLGKMGKGFVAGLQYQEVLSIFQQQGGVGSFMAQHLQQADANRDGVVDRQDWIRHFINVNVSEQELQLVDETIGQLDATALDELSLTANKSGLPFGWEKQESSSKPGVFYFAHSTLKMGVRLHSVRQVLEVERALGIFDRLLQIFGGSAGYDRVFTPAMLSDAARTLPQMGSAGVMLMQFLNTADVDRDGSVSRSDWANYFVNVGIPTNTLDELEQGTFEIWRQSYSGGLGIGGSQRGPSAAQANSSFASAPTAKVGGGLQPSAPTAMVLPQQVPNGRGDLFDLLDRNRDGVITRNEFNTAVQLPNETAVTTTLGTGPCFGGADRIPRPSQFDGPAEGPRVVPRA